MIISHKHKYLFVELPMTGSTAISKELRENYEGISILHKHSTYYDFLKLATEAEKRYFVLAGIRHPLDQVVSHYFKFKTDHRSQFTNEKNLGKHSQNLSHKLAFDYSHLRRFKFIQENEADFTAFFLKFYKIPYNNWSSMAHDRFDFIIRFESLADDFAKVIELMGLELKRPLPSENKTAKKKKDFFSYYDTPEAIERAKRVFGPYMQKWGYEFPAAWGDHQVSWWDQIEFEFYNIFRNVYWKYLRRPAVAISSTSIEDTRPLATDQAYSAGQVEGEH